jgi:hypothetical protein
MSDYFDFIVIFYFTCIAEGHKGYVGMNDEGVLMEGDKVPEDRRMMEKGDTGAICCWVLPSMVASSPMPLTCPIILTL